MATGPQDLPEASPSFADTQYCHRPSCAHPATPGQGEETTGAASTPSGRERTVGWAQLPW